MRFLLLFISLYLTLPDILSQVQRSDGLKVIERVYGHYHPEKWYRYFTFSQHTKFYKDGKTEREEVWHEASSAPGKLLIKFKEKDAKNGALFTGNKVYSYREGRERKERTDMNELTVFGFDVYFNPPERTEQLLDSLKFDVKKVYDGIWEGHPCKVIGANSGDSISNQVWYDTKEFVMRRIIMNHGNEKRDIRFSAYSYFDGKPVATRVIFRSNGELMMEEEYFDIKLRNDLPLHWFDPDRFNEVKLD